MDSLNDPKLCVGYIVTIDDVKLYASGDTSKTKQMESFAALKLDYALFPGDGLSTWDWKKPPNKLIIKQGDEIEL